MKDSFEHSFNFRDFTQSKLHFHFKNLFLGGVEPMWNRVKGVEVVNGPTSASKPPYHINNGGKEISSKKRPFEQGTQIALKSCKSETANVVTNV